MLADFILRVLGRTPAAYPGSSNKWATITADLMDMVVIPFFYVLSFSVPLLFLWWRKRKKGKDFTVLNILLAVLAGGVLAWGVWKINEWSYGYGLGIIHHEIYGR